VDFLIAIAVAARHFGFECELAYVHLGDDAEELSNAVFAVPMAKTWNIRLEP